MSAKILLLEAIKTRVLLSDGAMGTQLQLAGIEPGGCGEYWNLIEPEKVLAIQRAYAAAGSDCIITNTFGGCPFTLRRHGHYDKAYEINKAGAELARRALGERGWVLGDVGPFGGFLEPLGETSEADLTGMMTVQIQGLLDGGADAIIVETQTASEEASVGIQVARKLGAPCVIASFAYDKVVDGQRTMMGLAPSDVVRRLDDLGVDIFAANCGTGIDIAGYIKLVESYRAATDKPIMAQPNAGQPSMKAGIVTYLETPEMMAARVPDLVTAGARIVGGCCGTTPEHIRLFRRQVDQLAAATRI
jgi:5-methyltetrahydrofolate--homocysteine methyltransferase